MTDTVTLCLIVRDEAAFLPGCLASVAGAVDRVVVVDTGSTDDTPRLAQQAGATVVSFPWIDDFAAARNAALPHVPPGGWVLVLDADERLAPGGAEAIRAAVARGGFVLGLLPLHNAARLDATPAEIVSGAARRGTPAALPRLLRHTPDLAWEGIVHEHVRGWLERNGARVVSVAAPIVHYGDLAEVREARGKAARNRGLLEKLCAASPDEPQPWSYLASERARTGDLAGAADAVDRGWQALLRALDRGGLRPAVIPLASQRTQLQLGRGDDEGALATVVTARRVSGDHPNLAFAAGAAAAKLGRWAEAERELRSALAMAGRTFEDEVYDGVTGDRSRAVLARVLLRTDRPDDALAVWATGHSELAALGRAEAHHRAGRPEPALAELEPLLRGDDSSADAWTLAAWAMRDAGDGPSALTFAKRAAQIGRWVDPDRRVLLHTLQTELAFRMGKPMAGPGPWGTLGALVHRVPLAAPAPVPPEVVADAVLTRVDQGADLEPLFDRRAEALVPGIHQVARAALAGVGLDWTDDGEPDFVFVGGAGRSGTTLFRAMLSAHPALWCGPERKLVPALAETHARWAGALGPDLAEAGVDEAALDAAARAWLTSFLRAGAPAGRRIAEKTPHNLLHTAWLGRLFPKARFIHVLRDGRAVAESLLRQQWRDAATGRLLPYCAEAEQAGAYWATVVAEIRRQAPSVPGRYLEIRYEALVSDPRATMERVLAFLGEAWDDGVLAHESAGVALSSRESSSAAVAGARTTDRVERWREALTEPQLRDVVRAAGPVLEACGYG